MQRDVEWVLMTCEWDTVYIADEIMSKPHKDELARIAYEFELDYNETLEFLEIFRNYSSKDLVKFAKALRQAAIANGFDEN